MDSSIVRSYYLASRPMVANANIFGLGFQGFNISGANQYETIDTIESYNGEHSYGGAGEFPSWFESNAFGGTNYSNTPVGAADLNTDEPGGAGIAISDYGLWAAGKNFGICGGIILTKKQLSVGDPFVKK
ncbi:MAG TPA: hypothetical protein VFC07_02595 [Verrucomicrobiae bacterium]|nr:hypothetical protein [Verrucomicrobiae bacterium]